MHECVCVIFVCTYAYTCAHINTRIINKHTITEAMHDSETEATLATFNVNAMETLVERGGTLS